MQISKCCKNLEPLKRFCQRKELLLTLSNIKAEGFGAILMGIDSTAVRVCSRGEIGLNGESRKENWELKLKGKAGERRVVMGVG